MTKQRLQEYLWLKQNIAKIEAEIESIDSKLTSTTRPLNDMPKYQSPIDIMNGLTAKRISLEKTLNQQLTKSYIEREAIERAISSLPQREQYLFRLRYIEGKIWEDICIEMSYCYAQIHRVHRDILRKKGWV